ncbi:hypothetical protein FQ775_23795 [Nitratireductor mangrovi]|uniref:Uncharacterized protein n=1 Tax=Nitratireductor mangrovi TaxID=2599600 RepID=A0A6H0DYA6_9HYPH|nr:hypothetical protein [Nitratireductor mangrovi]QIS94631.1 hypothetical protein FQ775_23795 [Nitratireductor mangrovi]
MNTLQKGTTVQPVRKIRGKRNRREIARQTESGYGFPDFRQFVAASGHVGQLWGACQGLPPRRAVGRNNALAGVKDDRRAWNAIGDELDFLGVIVEMSDPLLDHVCSSDVLFKIGQRVSVEKAL